ncbi:hypothetical protein JCM11641_005552 [Rhodosporidiobolus odoratus]
MNFSSAPSTLASVISKYRYDPLSHYTSYACKHDRSPSPTDSFVSPPPAQRRKTATQGSTQQEPQPTRTTPSDSLSRSLPSANNTRPLFKPSGLPVGHKPTMSAPLYVWLILDHPAKPSPVLSIISPVATLSSSPACASTLTTWAPPNVSLTMMTRNAFASIAARWRPVKTTFWNASSMRRRGRS